MTESNFNNNVIALGKNNVIKTSLGDDTVDLSPAEGFTTVNTGGGDDIVYSTKKSKRNKFQHYIDSGVGNDQIFLLGNEAVTTGTGKDRLFVKKGAGSIILDLKPGSDFITGLKVKGNKYLPNNRHNDFLSKMSLVPYKDSDYRYVLKGKGSHQLTAKIYFADLADNSSSFDRWFDLAIADKKLNVQNLIKSKLDSNDFRLRHLLAEKAKQRFLRSGFNDPTKYFEINNSQDRVNLSNKLLEILSVGFDEPVRKTKVLAMVNKRLDSMEPDQSLPFLHVFESITNSLQ